MKNKKLFILVGSLIMVYFLLNMGKTEEPFIPAAKKGKVAKVSYETLRKEALKDTGNTELLPLPANIKDPFHSRSLSSGKGNAVAALKRHYRLKGIMLNDPLMAVILDDAGVSHVVRSGETFLNVTVLQVTRQSVKLKDPYGTFSLDQE